MWNCFLSALFCSILFFCPAFAADIHLAIHQKTENDLVSITVENQSGQPVLIHAVSIELDGRKYHRPLPEKWEPHRVQTIQFTVDSPSMKGSYPLIAAVHYLHEEKQLSLKNVSLFSVGDAAALDVLARVPEVTVAGEGDIRVDSPIPHLWALVLPEEIKLVSTSTFTDCRIFRVRNAVPGFRTAYPFFAVAQDVYGGRHRTCIYRSTLMTTPFNAGSPDRGIIPPTALFLLGFVFLTLGICGLQNKGKEAEFSIAIVKYASRMFFLAVAYLCLKNVHTWIGMTTQYIHWKAYHDAIFVIIENLTGGNYHHFFSTFIDAYFFLSMLLLFPYFYWLDRETHPLEDKYASLLKTVFSIPAAVLGRALYWNEKSRLGILTIVVKFFFVPLMVSWSIAHFYYLADSGGISQWNIYQINAFLVEVFIFLDTTIFAFGYLVESRRLKSEIKSIDPTLLGWVVCLWCYPPFNVFSFKPFDYYIIRLHLECPAWGQVLLTCIITVLWGVFAWATVALGFKASNLTNRGIVRTGPYRFVRHPAYTVKMLIWIIQGVFFAQFGLFILAGFAIIYVLRAWTEERHLSMDRDYLEYKRQVKWQFIPGIV